VVLAGVALLVALPSIVAAWPVDAAEVEPTALVRRALDSAGQPYTGYVETRGGLAMPDLPGIVDQVELFGQTSHLRAWFAGPAAWRVDLLSLVGERDMIQRDGELWLWDSSRRRAQRLVDSGELRLPRPYDLLPPELGRRLLAAAKPEELRAIAPQRVAGRDVPGVRVVPSSSTSTVRQVDVWVEPATGLPLRVAVTPRTSSSPRIEAQFLDLELGPPEAGRVAFSPPVRSRIRRSSNEDPLAALARVATRTLPEELAGLHRGAGAGPGAATYGTGFDSVVVVALPAPVVREFIPDELPISTRPWGEARLVETSLVNTMAFTTRGVGYLLSGAVGVPELDRIAAVLVAEEGAA
jgi:hypothetical protein